MTDEELAEAIAALRAFGTDVFEIEAKRAQTAVPKSLRATTSAFANTAGGVIILGLDEDEGFATVGVDNPKKMAADLGALCSDELEPAVRPLINLHDFEGKQLVVAEVPEADPSWKPCFYKGAGMQKGSYIRVGDSDRQLSSYEVQVIAASRGQPREDEKPVAGSGLNDLDTEAVQRFLARVKATRPHAFSDLDDVDVLRRCRVLVSNDGDERISVAGLLALGVYPQEHYPQLNLTFVHYPTASGEPLQSGERFLDNVTVDGPIPVMVKDALAAIRRNMTRRAVVTGTGRMDVWEYPEAALREAVVNALVHRDLSAPSLGTQIQVEMFPDRLRVQNPGGLFGPVTLDRLGEEGVSSSRNAVLLKLLEDVTLPGEDRTVCENRGSGIRTMIHALRSAGMRAPQFENRIATFEVSFPNHALMSDETVQWIQALAQEDLTDSQITALALLRDGRIFDNPTYRAATGVDSRVATAELQDLVGRELVSQTGSRRWAKYGVARWAGDVDPASATHRLRPADRRREILEALGNDILSRSEIATITGLPDQTVRRWLTVLRKEGKVEIPEGSPQSRNAKYRRLSNPEGFVQPRLIDTLGGE